jgi:hypothetical protein
VQFDYLKSLEIEEKINKIRWCQTTNGARLLLSTNDKTIKLWKVQSCHVSAVYNRMISYFCEVPMFRPSASQTAVECPCDVIEVFSYHVN